MTCPATPVPRPVIGGSADRFDPLIQLQDSRQQGIARAEARASTDRVVAAQRLARAEALALVRERAGALVAAKDCAGAENVARRGGAPDVLANVQTACAGRR